MGQTNKNIIQLGTSKTAYDAVNKQKEPGVYTVVDDKGKVIKVLTKTGKSKVAQHHRTEIKKMVEQTEAKGLLRASTKFEGEMDDFPAYDFQEAQLMMAKANSMFESLPSQARAKFENNPAKFMDFANNPANAQEMVDMGLAKGLDFQDHTGASTGVSAKTDPTGQPDNSGEVIEPQPAP
jgi:hypothetical protein